MNPDDGSMTVVLKGEPGGAGGGAFRKEWRIAFLTDGPNDKFLLIDEQDEPRLILSGEELMDIGQPPG